MCWVNKEKKRRGGGEESEGGKEGGKREGGRERERGEGKEGEGLGLEIVPVIRKILLQAILAARAAGVRRRLVGGESREGAGREPLNVEVRRTTGS